MPRGLDIAFFGSSLVSAYWNGAATYYRGIIRSLAARGHRVTFYEPDAYGRQAHRDLDDPDWARVVVYPGDDEAGALAALERARGADLVVKASGVGVFDELLEREVLALQAPETMVVFWDVDAPATLDRVQHDLADPFRALIPRYDMVFTYGGGDPVVAAYTALGARACVPVYNALDPSTHHPVGAGVPGQNRPPAVRGQCAGGRRVGQQVGKVPPHLGPVPRHQVVGARGEQALGIFPGRRHQGDAAGERLEHANRGNAGQGVHVRAPRDVYRGPEAGQHAGHGVIG